MAADQKQLPDRAGLFMYVSRNGALAIVAGSIQLARCPRKTIAWSEDMTWSRTSTRSGTLEGWLRINDRSGGAFFLDNPFHRTFRAYGTLRTEPRPIESGISAQLALDIHLASQTGVES